MHCRILPVCQNGFWQNTDEWKEEKQMELIVEEFGGSIIMLLVGGGVISTLTYIATLV